MRDSNLKPIFDVSRCNNRLCDKQGVFFVFGAKFKKSRREMRYDKKSVFFLVWR